MKPTSRNIASGSEMSVIRENATVAYFRNAIEVAGITKEEPSWLRSHGVLGVIADTIKHPPTNAANWCRLFRVAAS